MYVVGLSGGIGSGKTVASDHFAELGVSIVDTDIIARQIVEPGKPALIALAKQFGDDVIDSNGELNRGALRKIAFSSSENKALLDAITHPAIRDETIIQIKQSKTPYCLVVVPLLTQDSPFFKVMQRVLIVTADTETKIARVIKRSGLSRDEILRIMNTQLSDEERLTFADEVIANDSSLEHVYSEVARLHQIYLELSGTD